MLFRSEAELAAVLGHEIGHVAHKHTVNAIEKGKAVLTNAFELTGSDENDKQLVDEKIDVV